MAAFRFRLQPVYDLRLQLEKEQKDVFAGQVRQLNDFLDRGAALEREYSAWAQKYEQAALRGIRALEAMRLLGYLEELRHKMEQNLRQTAEQEQTVEQARSTLAERIRDRRLIEVLREKRYQEFRFEQQKEQEREVEEMISCRLA